MSTPQYLQKSIHKSDLLKNISTLAAGTALAQLIPILLQPLLRRLYTPETYGAFAVYLSILGIVVVISSFKYELAIILPRKDKEAANVFFLTIMISLSFNILFFLILFIWKHRIQSFLNLPERFINSLYFVPLGTFLYAFYQSANFWLIRKKRFLAIAQNKFIRRGIEGGTQVGFKYINTSFGLIWGDLFGHLANVISVSFQILKSGLRLKFLSIVKLKYIVRKYSEYPKFNVIPGFMSACSYLLPAIIINKFYSSENAGFFDLAKLMLSIPLALIATSIANVLLQKVSEKYRNGESFVSDLLPILTIVSVIAALEISVILLFGVDLFRIIFGESWKTSGQISRILVWSFAFNFIVSSFSSVFISMKKIKLLSAWQLVYFAAILSLFIFKDNDFTSFLRIYVMIEIACYILYGILMIIIISGYEIKIRQDS